LAVYLDVLVMLLVIVVRIYGVGGSGIWDFPLDRDG
jgi:hypothetical protein